MDPLGSTLNGGGGCTPYDRRTRTLSRLSNLLVAN